MFTLANLEEKFTVLSETFLYFLFAILLDNVMNFVWESSPSLFKGLLNES